MKFLLRWLSLVLLLFTPAVLSAQTAPVSQYETITLELWPDYDRPAVLVILNAQLPLDSTLPAAVTLPLPEGSTLNAVARVNAAGELFSDLVYEQNNGRLTFETPSLAFRVEYYVPYTAQELERQIDFSWTAPAAVGQLRPLVQKPLKAENMVITPEVLQTQMTNTGFEYYLLGAQPLAAGQTFTVQANYTLPNGALSRPSEDITITEVEPSFVFVNWRSILLGLFFFCIGAIFLASALLDRKKQRVYKPTKANFCAQCGKPVSAGDKFCRVCGHKF